MRPCFPPFLFVIVVLYIYIFMPDLTKCNPFFKDFLCAIFKMDFNPNSFFIFAIF